MNGKDEMRRGWIDKGMNQGWNGEKEEWKGGRRVRRWRGGIKEGGKEERTIGGWMERRRDRERET